MTEKENQGKRPTFEIPGEMGRAIMRADTRNVELAITLTFNGIALNVVVQPGKVIETKKIGVEFSKKEKEYFHELFQRKNGPN